MELPQSRPFGTEGRKPTHDFLSLYSHSTVQQDPRPPPSHGGFLKTRDFLQVEKINAKEESAVEMSSGVEKPPPPAPLPPSSSIEHILPGGIGTYSISHVSYFGQKVPKPEGTVLTVALASSTEKNDENSNSSSYTGSGFTLWEESAVKKGKTGKENSVEGPVNRREATAKVGQWTSHSSSNNNSHRSSFNSLSCSQPLSIKSQSLIEMINSAKISAHDEDLEDEDEFILKKENSSNTSLQGEMRLKVDGKSSDQKPNTSRSKHSATEQRRRSKINDRFQMLRELIPHSDQKRDKASFLLEVIEYIHFLQEKVNMYEGPYVGWNQEPEKLAPWRTNHMPAENYIDQSRGINNGAATALVFAAKFDEKKVSVSPFFSASAQNPLESDISTAATIKTIDPQPGITTNKAGLFPMSLQPNSDTPVSNGRIAPSLLPRLASDAENPASQLQAPVCRARTCAGDIAASNDKLKEQEVTAEGGTINISTVYSQGLLNTLTQALQSSGVNLTQASVSVQIDLGKRATTPRPIVQQTPNLIKADDDDEVGGSNQGATRRRDGKGGEDRNNKTLKRQKIGRS